MLTLIKADSELEHKLKVTFCDFLELRLETDVHVVVGDDSDIQVFGTFVLFI
jgi:hypothetical protein